MRAPEESWEQPFLEFQEMVDAKYAKEYPADFVERQVAHAAKLEAEAGGRDDDDAPVAVAATTDDSGFDKFYAIDDAADDDSEVGGGVCREFLVGGWQRSSRVACRGRRLPTQTSNLCRARHTPIRSTTSGRWIGACRTGSSSSCSVPLTESGHCRR